MRKGPTLLCLAGLALLLPSVNLGLAPHLQQARWDLTEDSLYSISPGTLKIIDTLPEPVELILFFSREQAQALVMLRSYAQRVEMLLREYERRSDGRLKLRVIDPRVYSSEEEQARNFGLQPLPLGPADTSVYFGLVANSASKQWKSLPLLSLDEQNFLEYDISRLIQSLHSTQKVGLGLMSSLPISAGFDPFSGRQRAPWFVIEEIEKAFAVEEISSEATRIPQDLRVLMLVHPKHLSRATLLAIDQFVLRGGRLLVFVDPFSEQDPGDNFFGIPSKDRASNIDPLFKTWGLRLLKGSMVADSEYGQYVNLPHQADPVWQPTAMPLQAGAMNHQDVVTSGLSGVNLTTAGILEPLEGASNRFTPLLHSSDNALALPTSRLVRLPDPAELARDVAKAGKRFTLAARIEGRRSRRSSRQARRARVN
ncbi:TPA: GldG family protein [Pseudomonas putida]|nr:GldG family protein [Pseudomonas putida]